MNILRVKQQDGTLVDIPFGVSDSSAAIDTHNVDTEAHADIRDSIPTKVSELTNDSNFIALNDIPSATDKVAGLTKVYPAAQCTSFTSEDGACTPAAAKKAAEMFGFNGGGNITGHLYLTGAQPNSSVANTSQIIFGTKENEHVALSSNTAMLVVNPNSTSSANQILLKLAGESTFPKGIKAGGMTPSSNNAYTLGTSSLKWSNVYATTFTGNLSGTATKATQDASGNVITDTYATKTEVNQLSSDIENLIDAKLAQIPNAEEQITAHNTNRSAHADIRQQISQLSSEKVDKATLSLGLHTDGKYYIFVNGTPVGTGMKFDKGDIFGYVDENNNIILNGNLTDGSYTVKYEMEDGSLMDIGDLKFSPDDFVNLLDSAYDTDLTTVYNGVGYASNVKWSNTDQTIVTGTKCTLTGLIPLGKSGDVFHVRGVAHVGYRDGSNGGYCGFYDKNGTYISDSQKTLTTTTVAFSNVDTDGSNKDLDENGDMVIQIDHTKIPSNAVYIRFCFGSVIGNFIISRNQLIPAEASVYSITNNNMNCTNGNSDTSITGGQSYSAVITPESDTTIDSITVIMGNVDVTSSVVDGQNISIPFVSGNIVINAIATSGTTQDLTFTLGKIDKSTGDISSAEDYVYSDLIPIDYSKTYIVNVINCACAIRLCYYDNGGNFIRCTEDAEFNVKCGDADVLSSAFITLPMSDTAAYFRLRIYIQKFNNSYVPSQNALNSYTTLIVESSNNNPYIEAKYTNLFDTSKALLNQRPNSSGSTTGIDGGVTTDFIDISDKVPFTSDTKIYIRGANFDLMEGTSLRAKVYTFKNSKDYTQKFSELNKNSFTITDEGNGVISISGEGLSPSFDNDVTYMVLTLKVKDTAITEADIQNIAITIDEPIYITNQIPLSINSDGSKFNNGQGWLTGKRLNSTAVETSDADMEVTGFIPAKNGDVIRFKNIDFPVNSGVSDNKAYVWVYNSSFARPERTSTNVQCSIREIDDIANIEGVVVDENGKLVQFTICPELFKSIVNYDDIAYIRVSAYEISSQSIITVNEEINLKTKGNLAVPSSSDWAPDARFSPSADAVNYTKPCEGNLVTNYIPAKAGDVIRVKGLKLNKTTNGEYTKVITFNANKEYLKSLVTSVSVKSSAAEGALDQVSVEGDIMTYTILMRGDEVQMAPADTAYIRISSTLLTGYTANDVVITVNEPIS